jgi:hypothetical protein
MFFALTKVMIISTVALIAKIGFGQTVSTLMSARTMALGNASVALADEWSAHNNPAGLAWMKGSWIGVAGDRYPGLVGADRSAATIGLGGRLGGISASVFRFGDDLYNEHLIGVAYANKLGLASLGSRVERIQYRAEGYETVVAWGLTIGTRAQITDRVAVAGYASNINRPHFPDGRSLPVRVAAGFAWLPSEKVLICGELEKIADREPIIKTGVELSPIKKVKFRTGFNVFPYALYGGIGLRTWKVNIDYAVSFSFALAYSHQVSIALSGVQQDK